MKKYTIVAGVNGAGKTTLYHLDPDLKCDNRVNADEILVEAGGDWKNATDVMNAGKVAVVRLKQYIEVGSHTKFQNGLRKFNYNSACRGFYDSNS